MLQQWQKAKTKEKKTMPKQQQQQPKQHFCSLLLPWWPMTLFGSLRPARYPIHCIQFGTYLLMLLFDADTIQVFDEIWLFLDCQPIEISPIPVRCSAHQLHFNSRIIVHCTHATASRWWWRKKNWSLFPQWIYMRSEFRNTFAAQAVRSILAIKLFGLLLRCRCYCCSWCWCLLSQNLTCFRHALTRKWKTMGNII